MSEEIPFRNIFVNKCRKNYLEFQRADKFVSGKLAFISAVVEASAMQQKSYHPNLFQQSMFKKSESRWPECSN